MLFDEETKSDISFLVYHMASLGQVRNMFKREPNESAV